MNCSNCGADLPPTTKFCRHCGTKTASDSTSQSQNRAPSRTERPEVGVKVMRPTGTGASLVAVVVLAIALGAGFWLIPGVGSTIKLMIANSINDAHQLLPEDPPAQAVSPQSEVAAQTEPGIPPVSALPQDSPPLPQPTSPADTSVPTATTSTTPTPSVTPPATQGSFSPSFDCRKASHQVEALVCGSQNLAQLDNELNRVYAKARASAADKNKLRADQAAWLTQIRNACGDEACLVRVYQERITALGATNNS